MSVRVGTVFAFACFFMVTLLAHTSAMAAAWYVGPGGSDTAGHGTDQATPFASLQWAIDQAASGDIIRVLGDLAGEGNTMVMLDKSGVTIEGYGASVDAYISSTWPSLAAQGRSSALVVLDGAQDSTIRYLTFYGGASAAVSALYVSGVTFDSCQFGGDQAEATLCGLNLFGVTDGLVSRCQVELCEIGVEISGGSGNVVQVLQATGCTVSSVHALATTSLTMNEGVLTMDAATSSDAVTISRDGANLTATASAQTQANIRLEGVTGASLNLIIIHGGATAIEISGGGLLPVCYQVAVTDCDIDSAGIGLDLAYVAQSSFAGNSISDGDTGLRLVQVSDSLFCANYFALNTEGLHLADGASGCSFFLNTFEGNSAADIASEVDGVVLGSPVPLHLDAGGRPTKAVLGNYFRALDATDANNDGIADSSWVSSDGHVTDPAPILKDYSNTASLTWFSSYLGSPLLEIRAPSTLTGVCTLADLETVVIPVDAIFGLPGSGMTYRGGTYAAENGFTGWMTFVDLLGVGESLLLTLGSVDDAYQNFAASGPSTIVLGDGLTNFMPFLFAGKGLSVPDSRPLAVQVTNQTGHAVSLLMGSARFCLSASLPPPSVAQLILPLLDD